MKDTKGKGTSVLLVLVIIIAVSIFIVIDASNRSSSITSNVIKTFKNCREVQVPYTATEEYDYYPKIQVMEGYQKERLEVFGKGIYQEGKVLLKNVDNEAGWVTVYFKWETLNDDWKDNIRHYIEPDETVEFLSIYDTNLGEDTKFTYTFEADPIKKTRTVTRYRIEERCD